MRKKTTQRKQSNLQFSILYILIFLFNLASFKTDAQVKIMNLVTDFGAVGDSTTDNTDAFIQAGIFFSNFLTNDTTGVLIIPSFHPANSNNPAVYKVGRQLVMNDSFLVNYIYDGVEKRRKFRHLYSTQGVFSGLADSLENYGMLLLNNVHGMVVQGSDSLNPPTIKYKDSLYFGSFMKPGYKFNQYKHCYSPTCITPYVPASISEDSSIVPAYGCNSCVANIALCACKSGAGVNPDTFAAPPIVINSILNASLLDTIPLNWYGSNYDQRTKAWIGQFITIQNSSDVTIKDLIIDGNNKAFKWGGTYSDAGIQLPHDGIFCKNTDSVTIKNVVASRFGHDGILVSRSNYISMDSCRFNENTRQGLSWAGGEYVSATNCTFNETGKNNIPSLSNPGAGLDIEPDYPDTCKYGYFYNCEFINNTGQCVVNDFHVSDRTYDVHFEKCTMFRKGENGLWCTGQNFLFDSCHIYCSVINSGIGLADSTATKYIGCDFEDKQYNNEKWNHNNPLFNINGSMNRTLFKDCTFTVNDSLREFCYLNWNYSALPADYTVIDNCTFIYNNKGNTSSTPSLIRNVRFKNENVIRNVNNSVHSYHMIHTRNVMIEGGDTACSPGSLSISGQVEHLLYSTSLPVVDTFWVGKKTDGSAGYAVYETDADAFTFAESQTAIVLNRLSAWRNLPKGSQIINGKFVFGGQVTCDAGSYFVTSPGVNHFISDNNNNTTDLLYIDKNANYNQTTTSPIWTTGQGYATGNYYFKAFEVNWLDTAHPDTTPCFQGMHPSLDPNLYCSPNTYSNMQAQGPFTLLYNLQVPCAGSDADMQFTVMGGKGTLTYLLDGAATDTNLTNIPAGQYTITVTDSSCSTDFTVIIDTVLTYKIVQGCVWNGIPALFTTNSCTQTTVTGPGTVTYSNDTVYVNAAGTYTITENVSGKTASVYIGECGECTSAPANAEWKAPDLSSTELFPDGIIPLNNIVLQGAIDIDSLLIFNNLPDIYCTGGTELSLADSTTFICTRTKMRGCTDYWTGISADGDGAVVIINNNSTIQDMDKGISISNNAFIQARGSTFLNNINSIKVANNMYPAIESQIYGNIFTGDMDMIANLNNNKPDIGIQLINMGNYNIGVLADTATKNVFENMTTGIYIKNNVSNIANSTIGIYNCKFSNIQHFTDGYDKVANCYISRKGAAIYCNTWPGYEVVRDLNVQNHNSLAATETYANCDKMVVGVGCGVTARFLKTESSPLGIMCNNVNGKHIYIDDNVLHNVHNGVQMIGNNTDSRIMGNIITTMDEGFIAPNWDYYIWPAAVHINRFLNTGTNILGIKNNNIDVSCAAGAGIILYNTNVNTEVISNVVALSTTDNYAYPEALVGIYGVNMNASKILSNTINGNDDLQSAQREAVHGLLINNSPDNSIQCNTIQKTRFGLGAISNCHTDSLKIRGNTMFNQLLGWTFRHLGTEGTFRDVGGKINDNNNRFLGSNYIYKVFKFCDSSHTYLIYTSGSTIDPVESSSYRISDQSYNSCFYGVQDNPGANKYECPVLPNYLIPPGTTGYNHTQAVAIITHTVTYTEFPEISWWMDKKRLYQQLENNSTFRNSNDTLLQFYNDMHSEIIAQIEGTDARLLELLESMESQNYDLYIQRLEAASETNSNIVSDADQEQNEETVNTIYLKILEYGTDTLDSEDSTNLALLSGMCPYIGGTAVYKARALYAMYQPSLQYDDITICNSIGVYKNGKDKGIFDDENEYLKSLKPKENILVKNNVNKFLLYPNPASNTITIAYELLQNEKGSVIVYDILGREQMKIELNSNANKVSINIAPVQQGIYTYKYLINKVQKETGKLMIKK